MVLTDVIDDNFLSFIRVRPLFDFKLLFNVKDLMLSVFKTIEET